MRLELYLVYLQFKFQLSRTIFRRVVRFLVDGRDRTSADVDRRMMLLTASWRGSRDVAEDVRCQEAAGRCREGV